jgi:multidrug resistance efflux pump
VRLAQRVPVRIDIDQTPKGVRLVAGMTATVQIDPNSNGPHWVIAALLWAKMAASWNNLFRSLYGGTCRG